MPKLIDLTGQRFGRLTVINRETDGFCSGKKVSRWLCICDCGKSKIVDGAALRKGLTKSCGCNSHKFEKKHGFLNHNKPKERIYKIWCGMRSRCNNKNNPSYNYYGRRGISVCSEWDDYAKFRRWSIENGYMDGLSIDRIDANGNYCPENCRWATCKEQQNNKRNNVTLIYNGSAITVSELAKITGNTYSCVSHRIKRGWSVEEIIKGERYV